MNDKIELKQELEAIVNLLFAFQSNYDLSVDQHKDLQEIMNHLQNVLNLSEDYDK